MAKCVTCGFRLIPAALIVLNFSFIPIAAASSIVQVDVGGAMNGHPIAADFLAYWNAHGGLAVNGLPITDAAATTNLDDGKSYITQWFERARYERHPENPPPYKFLLGRLGSSAVEGRTFDRATVTQSSTTVTYFPTTRHSLSNTPGPFKDYWEAHGGLAQFGYPISEQIQEVSADGKSYDVQYFERQRFEYHPEQADPRYKVLLGLLGVQQYKQQFVAPTDVTSGLTHNVDTLTIGMSQEPATLFSPDAGTIVAGYVLATIEHGLVGIDDHAQLYPDLAAFVPSIANGAAQLIGADGSPDQYLQIKWKLRHGLKWADGVEVTAKDAVYGWQGIFENANVSVGDRSTADKFSSFTAVDDYTIVARMLSENQAHALYARDNQRYAGYATQHGPVVDPLFAADSFVYPEHAYGKLDAAKLENSDYGRAPLGTGPYKVREWIAGQAIILDRNGNYNLSPNRPAFKTIVFKITPDTNQVLAQLETGQVDVATTDALGIGQIPQLDELAKAGRVKPYYLPSTLWEHIDFNLDNPLFQDKRVRQAFAYAINRQGIVDKVLYGKTVVAHTWITPNITQYFTSDVRKYEYAPAQARQLLAEAGYTAGSDGILSGPGGRMSFRYTTNAGSAYRSVVSQLVAADLKAVGIDARLEFIPTNVFVGPDGPLAHRTFEFAEYAWSDGADPGCALYQSSSIPTAANGYSGFNNPGWRDPANDALLNDICNNKNVALDTSKRAIAYKAEQQLFAEQLPTLPLHVRLDITAVPVGLHNYRPTGSSVPFTWNIEQWRLAR